MNFNYYNRLLSIFREQGKEESDLMNYMLRHGVEVRDEDTEETSMFEYNGILSFIVAKNDKPFVLLEGQSDIDCIKQAIELFKVECPKYERLLNEVVYLNFNGTGNAKKFFENFRLANSPETQYYFIFDHDDAGKSAMAAIRGVKKDSITNWDEWKSPLVNAMFYPLTDEARGSNDFLLEDYFSISTIRRIVNSNIKFEHPIKNIMNFSVKNYIQKHYNESSDLTKNPPFQGFEREDYLGFKVLLNKMMSFILGDEVVD